jgi:glucose/arabinose dehydrogenase
MGTHGRLGRLLLAALALALAACGATTPTASPRADGGSPGQTATTGGSTNPPLPSGPDHLALEVVADGLDHPIGIVNAGDGSGRLFVTEQAGTVRIVNPDGTLVAQPFVDLRDRVLSGGERGLLGLAFHPGFPGDGRVFVDYTRRPDGATVISQLTATAGHADPASERTLLVIPQPFANHNGGQLAFGPDGDLYIGVGDGGSGGDPFDNAQNTSVLLGKILRIDVDGTPSGSRPYAIPSTNPFAAEGSDPGGGAPEIWAYGLRNPWRFSFDPANGDLYIGDVGQGTWEEVDRQPGDSSGGENYGWNVMEGRHCYDGSCDQRPYVKPVAEYGHDAGCAITGGYVYRGAAQPALDGVYVFGDYCSGTIFTLQVDEGTITPKPVLSSGKQISALGVGEDGEIFLADLGGGRIYHVIVGS